MPVSFSFSIYTLPLHQTLYYIHADKKTTTIRSYLDLPSRNETLSTLFILSCISLIFKTGVRRISRSNALGCCYDAADEHIYNSLFYSFLENETLKEPLLCRSSLCRTPVIERHTHHTVHPGLQKPPPEPGRPQSLVGVV